MLFAEPTTAGRLANLGLIVAGTVGLKLASADDSEDWPRDAARSAAMVKMALQVAEDIQLPAGMQGKGLAR